MILWCSRMAFGSRRELFDAYYRISKLRETIDEIGNIYPSSIILIDVVVLQCIWSSYVTFHGDGIKILSHA